VRVYATLKGDEVKWSGEVSRRLMKHSMVNAWQWQAKRGTNITRTKYQGGAVLIET
jgi:hypothetical protein